MISKLSLKQIKFVFIIIIYMANVFIVAIHMAHVFIVAIHMPHIGLQTKFTRLTGQGIQMFWELSENVSHEHIFMLISNYL